MGIYSSKINTEDNSSKINTEDNSTKINNDLINVNFIQLKQKPGCTVTPEQLNMLLGMNVPKYSILRETEYPYLFCVCDTIEIEEIVREYGYKIGVIIKQKVNKNEFNSNHITWCIYYSGNDIYKLVSI